MKDGFNYGTVSERMKLIITFYPIFISLFKKQEDLMDHQHLQEM